MTPLRVGNASGFYGDRFSAVNEMLTGGRIDVLTGDYLAELTMLILGRDRLADPSRGYARTFLRQMRENLALARSLGVRIVTNAGGLNPLGLVEALRALGTDAKISYVSGDDLSPAYPSHLTANAYLGAWGISECLRAGADVVITGRVTDAALVVGPAAAHFGWQHDDFDALAGAVVAGHVLECGTQATGGNYSFFSELDMSTPLGFPIAEILADGSSVITKHPGTGGAVTVGTVTAQLLYEIDTPAYLGPDVVAHFDSIQLTQDGPDRVAISGVRGSPPPPTVKVCLNRLGGYRNQVEFVLTGLDLPAKEDLIRRQLLPFFPDAIWTRGGNLLRCTVKADSPDPIGRAFSNRAIELALASYPGFHVTAPPGDAVPYGVYTADYVPAFAHVAVLHTGERVTIPPPLLCTHLRNGFATSTFTNDDILTSLAAPDQLRLGVQSKGSQHDTDDPATLHLEVQSKGGPHHTADPGALRSWVQSSEGLARRVPLGTIAAARSGDKGGDANIGVWVATDTAYGWLAATLTADRLRELLSEVEQVDRYLMPNLRAVNFVCRGLLGEGVSSNPRFDPQAKALGEQLRACELDIPVELL